MTVDIQNSHIVKEVVFHFDIYGFVLRARIKHRMCRYVRSSVLPPRRRREQMRAHIFPSTTGDHQSIVRSLSEAIETVERSILHSNNTTHVRERYTAIAATDSWQGIVNNLFFNEKGFRIFFWKYRSAFGVVYNWFVGWIVVPVPGVETPRRPQARAGGVHAPLDHHHPAAMRIASAPTKYL